MGLRVMNSLNKLTITLFMLSVSAAVFAGSVWDGSVSTARYGYLPQRGLYAASNAFPQNTKVTVTNPKTGKSVDVVVLGRLEDNSLFLVLSSEAADSIGISYGEIFYGNITEQNKINSGAGEDLPYNPDPDINPSAASENHSELALIQSYIDSELGGTDDTLLNSVGIEEPSDTSPEPEITTSDNESPSEISPIPDVAVPRPVEVIDGGEGIPDTEIDTPLVDNMPREEIYNTDINKNLSIPIVVALPDVPVSVVIDSGEEIEDVPLPVGMNVSSPLLVASADISEALPKLPVPDTDTPVVSSMNIESIEVTGNELAIKELPELPIIGATEVIEDEKPFAVSMSDDVVPIEQVEETSPILPVIVEGEKAVDKPEVVEVNTSLPVSEPETALAAIKPEIVVPDETIKVPNNVEITLEPSDLRPPVFEDKPVHEVKPVIEEAKPVEVQTVVEENKPSSPAYKVTRALSKGSYYLQLGVYREQYSALAMAGSLGATYPVTVFISEISDAVRYKVMVGPLGADESGAVLYSFKSRGYPDAFLRKGL